MAKKRVPVAYYQNARFEVLNVYGLRLDLSELLMSLVLMLFIPLFLLGANLSLPELLLCVACLWSWPILLFGLRREGRSVSEWLGILLPYWTRQRTFSRRSMRKALDPRTDLVDRSVSAGPNLLSWEFDTGPDGVREIHVYENPSVPYSALIAKWREVSRQKALEARLGHPVVPVRRPAPVELP